MELILLHMLRIRRALSPFLFTNQNNSSFVTQKQTYFKSESLGKAEGSDLTHHSSYPRVEKVAQLKDICVTFLRLCYSGLKINSNKT